DGAARAAEVVVTAIDVDGKSAAIDRVRTALPSTKSPAPDPTWVRIASRLDVARAGHYQVRVGVRAAESDTTGTVFSELDVPEFAKSRLSMSGIVVGLQPDTDGLRSQAARLKGLLPI